MLTFLGLPSDVLLHLFLNFLEIRDIILLRRTCRELEQLTRDKTIWLTLLERLRSRGNVPLPLTASNPALSVNLSSATLESIVIPAVRTSESWHLPREMRPVLNPEHGQPISGLKFFLDTWLLIVGSDGLVYLWDIRENAPRNGYRDSLDIRRPDVRWGSYVATLAPGGKQILLAMSTMALLPPSRAVLYSIDIGSSNSTDSVFTLVQEYGSARDSHREVLALDTERCLVVLSSSTQTLDIVGWGAKRSINSRISLASDDDDEDEEMYNGVIALRFLGRHFLAIRTHSLELYLCDEASQPLLDVRPLKYRLPHPLREGATTSDILASISNLGIRYKLNVFLYDGYSLADYAITIDLPSPTADAPPTIDVTLMGEIRPPQIQLATMLRSRWFVSAYTLGLQGIRAMWVQRDNLTMTRRVRLCTLNRTATRHEMETAVDVFLLPSYDLREDLTHCALAEISGHIAVANRSGHVFLLPTPVPRLQHVQ
ncbi:hypothetical protein C8R46DRAFT_1082873 [Mycena filopes]|nr:hypothetical protein C8R46DRAFT_1082873 [Mycena filopes]